MTISVNVRVSGRLAEHVQNQTSEEGLYENASEYLRELIRKDLKENTQKKFKSVKEFNDHLIELANTNKDEFVDMDIKGLINKEKAKLKALNENY